MTTTERISPHHRRIAIAFLALVAFWPTLRLGFLWDDHVMIEMNPALHEWSSANIRHDFTTDVFDGHGDLYYRPAQTLMDRLDYTVWGLNPFGYHLTNLAFHAGASVLVGELVVAIGLGAPAALLAGCLFAVHPIGVEQLIIIAGRAELMSFFFMLTNLLFFLQEEPWCVLAGAFAYLLALFSKESAIIAPVLFALLLGFVKPRKKLFSRIWIYVLLTVPYLIIRSRTVGSPIPPISILFLAKFYIQAFAKILTHYVLLILIPWNLHSHRMIPHLSRFWLLYLTGWIGLSAWLVRKNYRWGLFCLAWFVLTLLPKTPAMIMGNFILDHWGYPAAMGVVIPMAMGFDWLWKGRRVIWKYRMACAFFPILIFWALVTQLNIELRGTDEKMYRWALRFTESHPIKYNLGVLLLTTGRAGESTQYFEDVRATYPQDADNLHALAIAYWQSGHPKTGMRMLEDLLKKRPAYQPAIQSLKKMKSESPAK